MIELEALRRQMRLLFPRLEEAEINLTPIEKGGSGRKFYRIQLSPDESIILVNYTREREENARFVEIARFLTEQGIRAPRIYLHDPAEGLIWMEDLGDCDLWSYRNETWRVRRPLYESALTTVRKLHQMPKEEAKKIEPYLSASFNEALYRWEQGYFFQHCLGGRFGVDGSVLRKLATLPALRKIALRLASFPRVLVHRDFQSQNLIVRQGQAYLIDFQGMRPGLAEYDLASLLYDPYVSLTSKEQAELSIFYQEAGGGRDSSFAEKLRLSALQRLMQALGAYGYLGITKGNPAFLAHIPAAMESLGRVAAEIEGLGPLRTVLQSLSPGGH